MKFELIITRLHFDMGLFSHQVEDKKTYIEDLFFYLSSNPIWYPEIEEEKLKYTITNARRLADDLICCDFIRKHDIKHNIIIDNETKEIEQQVVQNVVENVKMYYNKSDMLLFFEEKTGYGLDRKKVKFLIQKLIGKATGSKNNPADVDITFLGEERKFKNEVLGLTRILSSNMVLFPSNPSARIWDEIDKDLKETNTEKRIIKDKAPPKGTLNYGQGTKSYQMLNMIEDGYGEGSIRGISDTGELVRIHSKDLVEKITVNDKKENDLITRLLLKVSYIRDRFRINHDNE
ncbi:hypothetical protein [Desulfuromonas sp. TF]|uniref:hypothetical protein n=1 Tax=Desulfuromonas sp. TF TaxID=1232410 RepID=UPI0004828FA1|nr:hypothetical protein [Desulfuromonas sp. TF]